MTKLRKLIILPILLAAVVVTLSGCMGFGGAGAPEATKPPEKEFKSIDELKQAIETLNNDATADDEENLKGVEYYYDIKTLPNGAKMDYIKVSSSVVRVGYTFGETSEGSFDNRIELAYYRDVKGSDFLANISKNLMDSTTITADGIDHLVITAQVSVAVTPVPGSTVAATPTPQTQKYCQIVYWVQGDAAFISAVPLGFTKDDIGKYCQGVKADLN